MSRSFPLCYQPPMLLGLLLASALASGMDAPPTESLTEALAREASGDDAGALRSVEALVRAWPAEPLPRLEAARLMLKLGRELDGVEAHLEVASAVAPDNPRGHYLLGLLWEERRDSRAAVREYELALLYRPSYEDARFRLATLYASLGEGLKAELHFRTLARACPGWVQVGLQLARVLEGQGRLEEAERELKALWEAQPGHALVGRQLADFYERMGKPRLAARVKAKLGKAGAGEKPRKKKMRKLKPSRR